MATSDQLTRRSVLLSALLLAAPRASLGQVGESGAAARRQEASDSAAVVEVVDAFHRALATGDTARVRAMLGGEVRVLESGGLETREEYLSHHLPGDVAFASTVARERGPVEVTVMGDVAWAVSSSRTTGTFRGSEVDSQGAELMVLAREGDAWTIQAIHWSSRPLRR
jgi:ketosteroid isomerase-like protein